MLLLLLAGAGAFYFLQRFLYIRYWRRGLGVTVGFEAREAYEGDTAYLREEITNDKLLPLPALEVNLAMARALKFSGEAKDNANVTDQSYRRDIFSLFVRQKVVRRLSFVCEKRGFYEITRADVIGYDFFFRRSCHDDREFNTSMYVYPRLVDSRRIALLCRAVSGMVVTKSRLFPDPFQFAGIREYRPEDPMNQINWKASAKGQGLLVNQFDSSTNIRLKVILDTADPGIVRRDKLNEEGIRIAASLAARIVKGRMELTVMGNGMNPVYLKEGTGKLKKLYEELSRIDIEKEAEPVWELISREREELSPEMIYVVISMNQDEKTAGAVASLADGGSPVLWVVPADSGDLVRPERPQESGAENGAAESGGDSGRERFSRPGASGKVTVFRWEMEG